MLTIIADDITGAAEIAGIAHRYGLHTMLTVYREGMVWPAVGCDILVVATDTRSMSPSAAIDVTARIAREADRHGSVIFHKTDSALRGHVVEEIHAIMSSTRYAEALYLPANPSKGRTISHGTYYIATPGPNGEPPRDIPIAETAFSYDPEFPALTSRLSERFSATPYHDTLMRISMPDATSAEDITRIVADIMERDGCRQTLMAGAADLFTALIERMYGIGHHEPIPFPGLKAGRGSGKRVIIVRGSTQSTQHGPQLPVETMPDSVFYERETPGVWAGEARLRYTGEYAREGGCILTIGDKPVREGKHAAVYLRTAMATTCHRMMDGQQPDELVIEGGATAYAIISLMPHNTYSITDEIAPGVVRMADESGTADTRTHITLKPGSYEWGNIWKKTDTRDTTP
ncbi:MAG: four-carbon acid sugar kinase family protein [Prevotella sp.]